MEGSADHVFKNWAATYSCRPELYFEPTNLHDLRQILAKARVERKTVKVVGNRHSPSDIACTDGYMVSLKHFNKVLEIDAAQRTVRVEAGVLLEDLNEALQRSGLALSVLGSVSDITLGGAISTGTHGTGKTFGPLNDVVLALELLCANGEVLTLTRNDDDADTFHAACLGLGALGIILSVTVQCEPAFRLRQVSYGVQLKDVIENLDVHLSASEHFRFMWFPYTDGCVAYHCNRTDQPVRRRVSWFWDYLVGYVLLEFLYWTSTFLPRLVPWINRTYYRLASGRTELVDRSDRVFNFNCLFQQYVMEWAVPRAETGAVLWKLKAWIDSGGSGGAFVHFPVEVRFVKRDSALLSLSQGAADDLCYVNVVMYRPYGKDVEHADYWTAFQDIMLEAGGRPHWAKDFQLTVDHLQAMHPQWKRFAEIRDKLDPLRMFTNDKLTRVFGN